MASGTLSCPSCGSDLKSGYLYVRGFGAALFWSQVADTGLFSRQDLEQIDLSQVSRTDPGGQAIVEAKQCPACRLVCFRRD